MQFKRSQRKTLSQLFGIVALAASLPAWYLMAAQATNDPDLAIPKWSHFFNIREAAGFKDNVLLSQSQREASPLLSTELELFVVRLPVDDTEFTFFTTANDLRY